LFQEDLLLNFKMITGFAFGRFAPGKSILHCMDPGVKLIGAVLLVTVGFFSRSFFDLMVVAAIISLALIASNPSRRSVLQDFRALFLLYLVTILLHSVLNPGRALFELPFGLVITIEGLQRGLFIALIAVLVGALLRTTHPAVWNVSLGLRARWLKPLRRLIQPFALTFSLALRFLPLLIEEADRIRMAQISRGFRPGGGLIRRIQSLKALLIPMVVSSLDKVDTITIAMQSRGFRIGAERSRYSNQKFAWFDYAALILFIAVIAVFVLK